MIKVVILIVKIIYGGFRTWTGVNKKNDAAKNPDIYITDSGITL